MNVDRLLAHYERIADAPDAVPRLRRFILDLAVRGKLVAQDPNDEPAAELLKQIAAEKTRLVRAGKIKKQSALPPVGPCEAPFSVSNTWEWTRIGSTAYIEMGQSPPSEHYNRTGQGIPFFQGKADFGKRYPTARYWCTEPKKYAAHGDILISVRAPVGPTNVASESCCIGRGLAALRSHNGIDRHYLLRCLEAFEHELAALGFGTTFVAINKNQLTGFVIPLPPLAEQHRIVAKVDELMVLCDRLEVARIEREATRDRLSASSLVRLDAPDPDPMEFRNHAAFPWCRSTRRSLLPPPSDSPSRRPRGNPGADPGAWSSSRARAGRGGGLTGTTATRPAVHDRTSSGIRTRRPPDRRPFGSVTLRS